jgi:hypothetical protein
LGIEQSKKKARWDGQDEIEATDGAPYEESLRFGAFARCCFDLDVKKKFAEARTHFSFQEQVVRKRQP